MLVGEQPGDARGSGRAAVSSARPGRVLDEALADAGIDRGDAYVTNAVKHFKWKGARARRRNPPGGRTPGEGRRVQAMVCSASSRRWRARGARRLGAPTAAQALLGSTFPGHETAEACPLEETGVMAQFVGRDDPPGVGCCAMTARRRRACGRSGGSSFANLQVRGRGLLDG